MRAAKSAGRGLAGRVRIPPTILTCGGIGCGGSIAKSEHISSSASRGPPIGSIPNFRLHAWDLPLGQKNCICKGTTPCAVLVFEINIRMLLS